MNYYNTKNKFEKREKRKKEVIDHVKKEAENGNFPSYQELLKKFNIGFWRINLKDIYPELGISFLNLPFKRPQSCRGEMRKALIKYVRNEVKKGHYPSLPYIQSKFHLIMTPYLFSSMEELYKEAGVEYKMKNSQEIKNGKAKILTNIMVKVLPRLKLRIINVRKVTERGVDIVVKDKEGKTVGIELKAVNKFEMIKETHFKQLERFVEREKLDKIILVTTTDKIKNEHIEINNLEIINYTKLKELLGNKFLKELKYIRNQPIHVDTDERERKKKIIIEFVQKLYKEGKQIDHIVIRKNLGLYANTYFGSIFKLYGAANIPIPMGKLYAYRGDKKQEYFEYHIRKILGYMKEEIKKGNKPNCDDICKKFKINLWDYTSMSELYTRLEKDREGFVKIKGINIYFRMSSNPSIKRSMSL